MMGGAPCAVRVACEDAGVCRLGACVCVWCPLPAVPLCTMYTTSYYYMHFAFCVRSFQFQCNLPQKRPTEHEH